MNDYTSKNSIIILFFNIIPQYWQKIYQSSKYILSIDISINSKKFYIYLKLWSLIMILLLRVNYWLVRLDLFSFD